MLNQEPKIVTINNKSEEKFLRRKTELFDFSKFSKREVGELIKRMREVMAKANGIGLAANQIGLDFKMFVAQIQKIDREGNSRELSNDQQKFYAIFNPEVVKVSSEKSQMDEGCLSVPGGFFGEVERPEKITLIGFDKNGKKIKIKAWGLLARVFQHEVDHLNGILFIDKCKKMYAIDKSEILNPKS